MTKLTFIGLRLLLSLLLCNLVFIVTAKPLPQIDLSTSGSLVTIANNFALTTTGTLMPDYGTVVKLSYDHKTNALTVYFTNTNDTYLTQNQYTENNSDMWNQEVFEMFITAEDTKIPRNYIEIEINPNNALYASLIRNPNGKGTENQHLYLDATRNGMTHAITTKTANSWSGYITFPLEQLGDIKKSYRINFFRVVSKESHALDPKNFWACTTTNCVYLAWSPTMSKPIPAFHIPKYFGRLNIVSSSI